MANETDISPFWAVACGISVTNTDGTKYFRTKGIEYYSRNYMLFNYCIVQLIVSICSEKTKLISYEIAEDVNIGGNVYIYTFFNLERKLKIEISIFDSERALQFYPIINPKQADLDARNREKMNS